MLKRDDGVQIHEKTHLYAHVILCRTSSVKAETSYLSVFGRTSPIIELILALLVSCQRIFFKIANF